MATSILREPEVVEFDMDILEESDLEVKTVLDIGMCGEIVLVTRQENPSWKVVMKMFCWESLQTKAKSERNFQREAKFMQSLDHKYIMKCLSAASCPDYLAITLKYYHNRSLNFYVGDLDLFESEMCIAQVGCALRYLHTNNLVHLDVKLDNIFIDESYNAILGDFGLAMEVDPGKKTLCVRNIGGTPAYIAPECHGLAGDDELDPFKLDAHGLGVVYWSLVSGLPPGPDIDYYDATVKNIDLEFHARDMLKRLLDRDASTRFTVANFLSRLRRDRNYRYIIDRY